MGQGDAQEALLVRLVRDHAAEKCDCKNPHTFITSSNNNDFTVALLLWTLTAPGVSLSQDIEASVPGHSNIRCRDM